jgi:Flp pilus assembly protein TadD
MSMDVINQREAVPFTTADGSTIRELLALGYSESNPLEEAEHAAAGARQDLHRAFSHFEARNLDEAIPALRRAIAAAPGHLQAILLLASSLLAKGEREECRALAGQVAADPRLAPYAALLLGMLATSDGHTDEALTHFAEAEEQGGSSSYLLGNVAWAHLAAKRFDEAERLFKAIRELEPESALAPFGLAIIHAERGKPAESADEALLVQSREILDESRRLLRERGRQGAQRGAHSLQRRAARLAQTEQRMVTHVALGGPA